MLVGFEWIESLRCKNDNKTDCNGILFVITYHLSIFTEGHHHCGVLIIVAIVYMYIKSRCSSIDVYNNSIILSNKSVTDVFLSVSISRDPIASPDYCLEFLGAWWTLFYLTFSVFFLLLRWWVHMISFTSYIVYYIIILPPETKHVSDQLKCNN